MNFTPHLTTINLQKCSMRKPNTNNKTLPTRLPQWRDSRKKYNIQGYIEAPLGKNFELEKMMRFLKETEMFEEM